MAPAASRRLPPLMCVGALFALAAAVWWQAPAAHAQDNAVMVHTDRYDPAEIRIQGGQTVTWTWASDGGSVTADDGSFDSHEDCVAFGPACGQEGETFAWTFDDVDDETTYTYVRRGSLGSVTGTVTVEPAPEPDPTDSSSEPGTPARPAPTSEPDPVPSPTVTNEPEPSPTVTSEPEPSPTGTSEPAPDPAPPPPPDPEPRTAAQQPVERDSTPGPTPTAVAPTVAADASPSPIPEPSFEAFPDGSDPGDDRNVEGQVAIGGSDDTGDTGRTVWALIGGASVLGTLGAFGRTVLFSDAWTT